MCKRIPRCLVSVRRVMQVDRRWTEVFSDAVRESVRREDTSKPMKSSCHSAGRFTPRSQPLTIRNSYRSLPKKCSFCIISSFTHIPNRHLKAHLSHPISKRRHAANSESAFVFCSCRGQFRPSSMPSIPNPFPELCSPSHSPVRVGSLAGSVMPTDEDTHVSATSAFYYV